MGHSTLIPIKMRLTTKAFVLTALWVVLVYLAEAYPKPAYKLEVEIKPYPEGKSGDEENKRAKADHEINEEQTDGADKTAKEAQKAFRAGGGLSAQNETTEQTAEKVAKALEMYKEAATMLKGVSPEKIEASIFTTMDSNGDGAIDKNELRDYEKKQGTWNAETFENGWAKMDVNNDEKITPNEVDSMVSVDGSVQALNGTGPGTGSLGTRSLKSKNMEAMDDACCMAKWWHCCGK